MKNVLCVQELLDVIPLSAADLPGMSGRFAAASVARGRQRVAKHRDHDAARNTVEVGRCGASSTPGLKAPGFKKLNLNEDKLSFNLNRLS